MKNVDKKLVCVILCFIMILNLPSIAFAAGNAVNSTIDYDKLEYKVSLAEDAAMSQYSEALNQALEKEDYMQYENLLKEASSARSAATQSVYQSAGLEMVDDVNDDAIIPYSSSTNLTWTSENAYFDRTAQVYVYTVNWAWTWGTWDEYSDIDDLAGVSMTNTTDYYIQKSYAKTWDSAGRQSGYVNEFGNHEPQNTSYSTKRYEDASGVIFNVNDEASYLAAARCYTDQGRITLVIKHKASSKGTPANKFIASYEHNYKTSGIGFAAKINSLGFSSLTGAMSVNYEWVNKHWLRSSGGCVIGG